MSALLLNVLAEASGVAEALLLALGPGDDLSVETVAFAPLAAQLHRDALPFFGILPDGTITTEPPAALLPGSVNPPHAGPPGPAGRRPRRRPGRGAGADPPLAGAQQARVTRQAAVAHPDRGGVDDEVGIGDGGDGAD